MNDFEVKVLDYIVENRARMERLEANMERHIEGVMQNRARIETLEQQEENIEDEIKDLKAPSDTKVTFNTLIKWGKGLIVIAATGKILYDIFN